MPPYTAVIFTSVRTVDDSEGYNSMAVEMERLAAAQPGYLGIVGIRDEATRLGITVSYWVSPAAAAAWKEVADHLAAQELGRRRWYQTYRVEVATVERAYGPGMVE